MATATCAVAGALSAPLPMWCVRIQYASQLLGRCELRTRGLRPWRSNPAVAALVCDFFPKRGGRCGGTGSRIAVITAASLHYFWGGRCEGGTTGSRIAVITPLPDQNQKASLDFSHPSKDMVLAKIYIHLWNPVIILLWPPIKR